MPVCSDFFAKRGLKPRLLHHNDAYDLFIKKLRVSSYYKKDHMQWWCIGRYRLSAWPTNADAGMIDSMRQWHYGYIYDGRWIRFPEWANAACVTTETVRFEIIHIRQWVRRQSSDRQLLLFLHNSQIELLQYVYVTCMILSLAAAGLFFPSLYLTIRRILRNH
jgi:hypothetical protein